MIKNNIIIIKTATGNFRIDYQLKKKYLRQGLLYHRTCNRKFLCSCPSLNSYLK